MNRRTEMDRRSFGKLLAGTVTAAGIPRVNAAKAKPAAATEAGTDASLLESSVMELPAGGSSAWELVILDAVPPHITETGGTAADDIDGDGKTRSEEHTSELQ